MLATSERVMILDAAEELAKMVLESDVVGHYYECIRQIKQNQDTQRKIQAFVDMKEQYEDVQRFGRYHPDYKKVSMDIRHLKRAVDLDERVAEFKRAENDLQSMLDEISVEIGRSVSEYIKVPTGNPFFDSQSGCSGGCSTGGSCGCS